MLDVPSKLTPGARFLSQAMKDAHLTPSAAVKASKDLRTVESTLDIRSPDEVRAQRFQNIEENINGLGAQLATLMNLIAGGKAAATLGTGAGYHAGSAGGEYCEHCRRGAVGAAAKEGGSAHSGSFGDR